MLASTKFLLAAFGFLVLSLTIVCAALLAKQSRLAGTVASADQSPARETAPIVPAPLQRRDDPPAAVAQKPPEAAISMTTVELHALYGGNNEAAADKICLGKTVETLVWGEVRKALGDSYYFAVPVVLEFQSGAALAVTPTLLPDIVAANSMITRRHVGVICRIAPGSVDEVARHPGEAFVIRGRCDGREDGFGWHDGYAVVLSDCRVTSHEKIVPKAAAATAAPPGPRPRRMR